MPVISERFFSKYFLKCGDYKLCWWNKTEKPEEFETYFCVDENKIIAIHYGFTLSNFGLSIKEKLETIDVAYRDGITEYDLFDKAIQTIRQKHKRSTYANAIFKMKNEMPIYQKQIVKKPIDFKNRLVDTKYKTSNTYTDKYIVVDVETNGIRKANDDLLSVSIYDPLTGSCYNRFLPLDLQPTVLTTFINGITDDQLNYETHINQEELNQIISYFDLNNSVILSYSGGKGLFDSSFLINYCKRHNLHGLENLNYKNIKSFLPKAPYGCDGELSKDNICKKLNIHGVKDIHSGINDCLLEWKLFEKLYNEPVLFIGTSIYKYNKDYIIPVSYLFNHEEFLKYANISLPNVVGYPKKVFSYSLPKKALNKIQKYETNITGITIEHLINVKLNANKQDNRLFLIENKKHLTWLGNLESSLNEIPIMPNKDGLISAVNKEDIKFVEMVNKSTKEISSHIQPIINFIQDEIFKNEDIMSQELAISDDKKVLALCDLSSKKTILEIKTFNVLQKDSSNKFCLSEELSRQLFYESKQRETFVMSMNFDYKITKKELNKLTFNIYRVFFKEKEKAEDVFKMPIAAKVVLNALMEDNTLSIQKLSKKLGRGHNSVVWGIDYLTTNQFIKKSGDSNRYSTWIVLKDSDGKEIKTDNQVTTRNKPDGNNYKERIKIITEGRIEVVNYYNYKAQVTYKCNVCGHIFRRRPADFRKTSHYLCPNCRKKNKTLLQQ